MPWEDESKSALHGSEGGVSHSEASNVVGQVEGYGISGRGGRAELRGNTGTGRGKEVLTCYHIVPSKRPSPCKCPPPINFW